MGLNAFIKFTATNGKVAEGESKQAPYDKQTEIQGWDWEVEAESSWDKGGGASVGKAKSGKFNFEHYYDKSSNIILFYICSGTAFSKVELTMCKGTGVMSGSTTLAPFFQVVMTGAYITKVTNNATEEGNVVQKVEFVFKDIEVTYHMQGNDGKLNAGTTRYSWSLETGKATT